MLASSVANLKMTSTQEMCVDLAIQKTPLTKQGFGRGWPGEPNQRDDEQGIFPEFQGRGVLRTTYSSRSIIAASSPRLIVAALSISAAPAQ